MLTIKEARKLIPNSEEKFTDEDIKEIIRLLNELAEIYIDCLNI